MIRSANPVFKKVRNQDSLSMDSRQATFAGVGLKTLYYIFVTIAGAFLGLFLVANFPEVYITCLIVSIFLGVISAIIAMSKANLSLIFGTLYCAFEGMFLGTISMLFEAIIPGIIVTVITSTLAVVLICAVLFLTGLVKVNNKFYKFLMLLSIGFCVSMLFMWILSLCGFVLMDSFGIYILVSIASVFIASLYLLSDMEQAYQLVKNGGAKEFEWMVSFGLAYTILWLYVELLRIVFVLLNNRN